MDKRREQFEAWITSYIGGTWLKRNDHQVDEYLDENTQFMWEAWQASRDAVVIELEEHYCYDRPGDAYEVLQDCKKAIEAQGLKVAP